MCIRDRYKAFPDVTKLSVNEVAAILKSESGVARLAAQQELLTRPAKQTIDALSLIHI